MKRSAVGLGGASLILIFSVLCLAVFSVLALAAANREQKLTDKRKTSTTAYYEADGKAVEIEAKLKTALSDGKPPDMVDGVTVTASGDRLAYDCPIDERRSLSVILARDGDTLRILQWCETDIANWTPQQGVDVWKGE